MLQDQRAGPGPLGARSRQRGDGAGRLRRLVRLAPEGGAPGPTGGQCVPAPVAGPDRLVRVTVRQHHLPQQDQPREVEHVLADAPVVGARVEAVGFSGHDVEIGPGPGLVELRQVPRVAQVLRAGLDRGRQPRQQDAGLRVGPAHRLRRAGQQVGVGQRADRLPTPALGQVRLVPDLVVVHLRRVPRRERLSESSEAVWISGQLRGTVVEHGHQPQSRLAGHRGDDAVGRRPVVVAGLRFDLAPVEGLAHPNEAAPGDARERCLQRRVIVLLQRHVDAEQRHVRLSHGWGKGLGNAARARLVAHYDSVREQARGDQPNQPQQQAGRAPPWASQTGSPPARLVLALTVRRPSMLRLS